VPRRETQARKSGRGLPHSKTLRAVQWRLCAHRVSAVERVEEEVEAEAEADELLITDYGQLTTGYGQLTTDYYPPTK